MKTIAVIFGGKSVEHDISIITGTQAIKSAELIYNVVPIYITKTGEWLTGKQLCDIKSFEKFDKKHCKQCYFKPNCCNLFIKGFLKDKQQKIDMCLVCLHGQNGEDGSVQGYLKQSGVPFSGCGVCSSAVTFDKVLTKQLFISNGIPTTNFVFFNVEDYLKNQKQVLFNICQLKYPVIVKPARLGSSVGIERCQNKTQLKKAIEFASHFDTKIIVEKALTDFEEINISVMKDGDELVCSSVEKIELKDKIFGFDDKYINDNIKRSFDKIDKNTESILCDLAKQAYKACDCSSVVRIDFLIDKRGTIFVNEINTVPGSLAFYLWKKKGFGFSGLIARIVKNAEMEAKRADDLSYVLNTDAVVKFSKIKCCKMNK